MRSRCSRHEFLRNPALAQYVSETAARADNQRNPRNRSETFAAEFLDLLAIESTRCTEAPEAEQHGDQQHNVRVADKMQQVIDERFWRGEQVGPTANQHQDYRQQNAE